MIMGLGHSKDFDTSILGSFWDVIILGNQPIETFLGKYNHILYLSMIINVELFFFNYDDSNVVLYLSLVISLFSDNSFDRIGHSICIITTT